MKKLYILFFLVFAVYVSLAQDNSPILTEPPKNEDVISQEPLLNWTDVPDAVSYSLEITQSYMGPTVIDVDGITESQYQIPEGLLDRGVKYFWKVRAVTNSGYGDWSNVSFFRIVYLPPAELDYIKGVIQSLEETMDISQIQGGILKGLLNQAKVFLLENKPIPAKNKINAFKNHVQALINGNLISPPNGFMLNKKSNNVIIMIDLGFTTVQQEEISEPNKFYLAQNYPNPFNPETYIDYYIPENSNVTINIYNSLGEKIDVLADTYQNAGRYIVKWNAKDRSSGLYFYTMNTGKYSVTKKMILIK